MIVFIISVLPEWFCPQFAARVKGSRFVTSLLCRRKVEDSVHIRRKYRSAVEALQQEFTSRIEQLAHELEQELPSIANGTDSNGASSSSKDTQI